MADGTTTTLAETLLDDLDDLSDEDTNVDEPAESTTSEQETATINHDERNFLKREMGLQIHLQAIRERPDDNDLIIPSNKYLAHLSTELDIAHQDLMDAYSAKFPDLAELVTDPKSYANAVKQIGNEMDVTRVDLSQILTPNQIITISVACSTTLGRPLTEEELAKVDGAYQYMQALWEVQQALTDFVKNRINDWAPNTSALVGPAIASQLIGMAGGLAELSRIPACNLQVLGQAKANATARGGLSTISSKPHTGILINCDLVQSCPSYLRKKALKVVAAKLALAVRCDYVNVDTGRARDSSSGEAFRAKVQVQIQQWQVPDKAPVLKALPKPDLAVGKRRGGKRMRRLKERFEETELMKQANTRAFHAQAGEYGDDAMGLTVGMLDTDGGGAVRKTTEKRKLRHANTKASRKRQIQMAKSASNASNGLASSMVFTPVQGIELVDPGIREKRVSEANKMWFSKNAGFLSALPKDK